MKIALCSDEWHPIHQHINTWLKNHGHETVAFGSFKTQQDESWVDTTQQAAREVAAGACEKGIFCCWSGTGASIAANKIKGIRAALCWDEETTDLANTWNHANVLVLPNRILTPELADKILTAWFKPYETSTGLSEVAKLQNM